MANITIHGGTAPINLGQGYTLRSPGIKGSARILGPKTPGSRGPEQSTEVFDNAFNEAGIEDIVTIELMVSTAPYPSAAAPVRGPEGTDAFELQTPDFGPDYGQIVLSIDEAGALHWHFPLDETMTVQPSTVRGAGGSKTFLIPRDIAQPADKDEATQKRGLLSIIGRKLLKVIIYPVADAVLGPLTDLAVGKWEKHKRPHRFRHFTPGNFTELTPQDWIRLANGRSLLFVHGTFSTAQAAFGDLSSTTLDTLSSYYGGRVFAFDHPTLSKHPHDNVSWFFSNIPQDITLDMDIICHSRGGLVSRCLASSASKFNVDPARFQVKRMVLAGVPNQGTLLANPDHMVSYLDRMTTALNLFPDNGITDILEGILTVVKVIGHAGLTGLDGLASMRPDNPFLHELDISQPVNYKLYGLGGDFEPTGSGLGTAFCTAADSMIDRIFKDAPNDLVVPTAGMRNWGGTLQIPDDNFLSFPADRGVMHTSYFRQPESSTHLLKWLRQ